MGFQDTKNSREQIEDKRKYLCKDFSFMAVEYALHPDVFLLIDKELHTYKQTITYLQKINSSHLDVNDKLLIRP